MDHSFLVESGDWNVDGHWLKSNSVPIPLQGKIEIVWKRENWFEMTTRLVCNDKAITPIAYQCHGNFDFEEKYYTYVAQHNLLGNIEGEGRLGFQTIIQYYWLMETNTKQKGLDTFYCLDRNTYHLTSSILDGHSLKSTIEATLKR
ncbi:hypothetical protein IQ255_14105 [Pleurocapsales cyanobacterium LEGE 10410]|nr:hypothetical protein [Pleurocapsales cyanobacterium LEGE 10410]